MHFEGLSNFATADGIMIFPYIYDWEESYIDIAMTRLSLARQSNSKAAPWLQHFVAVFWNISYTLTKSKTWIRIPVIYAMMKPFDRNKQTT